MKTFYDLEFKRQNFSEGYYPSIISQMMFDNGYGISVVQGEYTYGGKLGLYEIAVLDKYGDICYTSEITNDVIGHLTELEVSDYMIKIQKLTNIKK